MVVWYAKNVRRDVTEQFYLAPAMQQPNGAFYTNFGCVFRNVLKGPQSLVQDKIAVSESARERRIISTM